MEQAQEKSARIDMRLPVDQKSLIEYAARIAGYRSVTEFILNTLYRKAERIIKRHEVIIASRKDQEVFFNALLNPPHPNENLVEATKKYNNLFKKE